MSARLYIGEVMHARLHPARHVFRYPALFFCFDVDDLPALNRLGPLFGYNRPGVLSLYDRDHLYGEGSIGTRIRRLLAERGLADDAARIELVTSPRYFGHAFNPVRFYYVYRADGSLRAVVAEVNNTFGERHLYVLDRADPPRPGFLAHYAADKAFHVSPFNNRAGQYAFDVSATDGHLDIRVDLMRDGQPIIKTRLHGPAQPLTRGALLRALARYPFNVLLTLPRIHWQAARLFFGRRLRIFAKPVPGSDDTMQVKTPRWTERLALRLVLPHLEALREGHLTLTLPDRRELHFGTPGKEPAAALRVRDYRFFSRLLRDGEIGFGESYMSGEWDSPDVTALIRFFLANREMFERQERSQAWLGRLLNRVLHLGRANTRTGSRRNIAAHYDLSNEFYRLFLDASMLYSCALWHEPGETLEQAQMNKLHRLIEKAGITAGDHVLEIGTGWGAFAIEAVRRTGCRVTTVTISQQQYDLARRRVEEAGLADRIEVRLCDYRDIEGRYDRIVSIEMLEAVGHAFLGDYFGVLERALKPGGTVALQVITMPDARYEQYRRGVDWIQKHIFPGGHLPSLGAIRDAVARGTRLAVGSVDNIGVQYARTLHEWRDRFVAATDAVQALGFDETFRRKWFYYLSYCEAAFAARAIDTLHVVLRSPQDP